MASSTELSDCIAESLGLPKATVLLHMRNVREAGFLSQGGRGRNSARMTFRDAAALIIAASASIHPKDSVSTYEFYSKLPLSDSGPDMQDAKLWRRSEFTGTGLDLLDRGHLFEQALELLIEGQARNPDFIAPHEAWMSYGAGDNGPGWKGTALLISFDDRFKWASISARYEDFSSDTRTYRELHRLLKSSELGKRRTTRSFSGNTIRTVAKLLSE